MASDAGGPDAQIPATDASAPATLLASLNPLHHLLLAHGQDVIQVGQHRQGGTNGALVYQLQQRGVLEGRQLGRGAPS